MITYNDNRATDSYDYRGTSQDDKPLTAKVNDIFLELDTGNFYYFDGEEWQAIGG